MQVNQFQSTLPTQLGRLSNMTVFQAQDNELVGPLVKFPPSLEYLDTAYNNMTGIVDVAGLTNLIWLAVHENEFSALADSIGTATSLQLLYLFENSMTGTLPTTLGNLQSLSDLRLQSNSFVGELPPQLSNCVSMTTFLANDNMLTGPLPRFANTSLQYLHVENNMFTGVADLTRFTNLITPRNHFEQLLRAGRRCHGSWTAPDLPSGLLDDTSRRMHVQHDAEELHGSGDDGNDGGNDGDINDDRGNDNDDDDDDGNNDGSDDGDVDIDFIFDGGRVTASRSRFGFANRCWCWCRWICPSSSCDRRRAVCAAQEAPGRRAQRRRQRQADFAVRRGVLEAARRLRQRQIRTKRARLWAREHRLNLCKQLLLVQLLAGFDDGYDCG
jgi:hypothetical protein